MKGTGLKGKKVLVLGMARSGFAVAKKLLKEGAVVTISDQNEKQENGYVEELSFLGATVQLGPQTEEMVDRSVDLVVKNPGIPYRIPVIQKAMSLGIPIVTEVEIGYLLTDKPIIGITGSNGKTTVTTLVYEMLRASGQHAVLAGNIGFPFVETVEKETEADCFVVELSSFQLMGIQQFQPAIACVHNLTPSHLDYHTDLAEYKQAKFNLFQNQTHQDIAVLNADQPLSKEIEPVIQAKKYWYSATKEVAAGTMVENGYLVFKNDQGKKEQLIKRETIALPGQHNLENVLAAVLMATLQGAKKEAICQVLQTFSGVKHRLQYVTEKNQVKYYNDSKATNPKAASIALRSFQQPIIHIAGGLDRGNGFEELEEVYKEGNVRMVISFGQSSSKISRSAAMSGIDTYPVRNLTEAVALSKQLAAKGDVVLLSPACASWDMYPSFEDRGDEFIRSVEME